ANITGSCGSRGSCGRWFALGRFGLITPSNRDHHMGFLTRLISYMSFGSSHPLRRLASYYAILLVIGFLLFKFVPQFDSLLTGERLARLADSPSLLQDGLPNNQVQAPAADLQSR